MATVASRLLGTTRRRLGGCAAAVAVLARVFSLHQGGWAERADDPADYRRLTRAEAIPCLTAHGLRVTSVGGRTLRVADFDHLRATLTFYPTTEEAQAVAAGWGRTPSGAAHPLRRAALDNVTVRVSRPLDDATVRLLGGCVGMQPVKANA